MKRYSAQLAGYSEVLLWYNPEVPLRYTSGSFHYICHPLQIVSRAKHLISQGIPASKIQILTFTKRTACEIVQKVGGEAKGLNGATFHSWCNQLLSRYPKLFGLSEFTIIAEDDQVDLMKLTCGKKDDVYAKLRIKSQGLVDLYSFMRNTKKDLKATIQIRFNNPSNLEMIESNLATIFRQYEAKKKKGIILIMMICY